MSIRFLSQYLIVALALLIPASVCAQSSFYLTFERSFSTREDIQLRVDYADRTQPFQVRILRPASVERFLEGQFNVSRSYEEPRAALNPSFFLTKGVNALGSPVRAFQKLLSPEFRNSFGEEISPSLRKPAPQQVVGQSERVVYEPPPGFEVVRETAIDVRRGGTSAADSWWWFFDEVGDGSGFAVRDVNLGRLPSGLYMVQVLQRDQEAQALLQVSELSVQVKQSSRDLLIRSIDRDGKSVSGASVEYRDDRGEWRSIPGTTSSDGSLLYRHTQDLPGKLIVRVRDSSGNSAYADTDFLPTRAASQSMFVMTDRPIFRPGDTVSFKGFLRRKEQGLMISDAASLTGSTPVSVSLAKPGTGNTLQARQLQQSTFGTLSGAFDLGEFEEPGLYSVVAQVNTQPYAGELRVRDYVKPTFYLELVEREGLLRPGNTFKYKIRARRYAGGVPRSAEYDVFVYRKKYEVPKFVEDAGGGLSTGTDYFGASQSASALAQPQRVYSSTSPSSFDERGESSGEISLTPLPKESTLEEWTYTILFRAKDRDGASSVLSENFYQTVAEGVVSAQFSSSIVEPGQKGTTFTVRATTPEGDPLAEVEGEAQLTLSTFGGQSSVQNIPFKTDKAGYAVVAVNPYDNIGLLQGVAIARGRAGKAWTEESRSQRQELIVVKGQGESVCSGSDVSLYASRSVVSPGDKVKVYALLPDTWGAQNKGSIWRSTAGESVFATSSIAVEGRSLMFESEAKSEYGTGYFETISVPMPDGKFRDATMAFRVIPNQQRFTVEVRPEGAIGEPMKPFEVRASVKRFDGSPARGVEVSLAVVDRAVYAIQPEFRPSIFDFFFPLPRLNVMTFYSDELQGYGYADKIRKPNFSLSAIKSQTKLSKRSVRDTAGWFPHLVTDESGMVSATVNMPSNLTEWLVTAVAVGTNGECGEGQGRFRTAVDVEVEPRAPQFLRRGDEVVVPVALRNQTDQEIKLDVEGRLDRQNGPVPLLDEKSISVAPRDAQSRAVRISTDEVGDSLVLSFSSSVPSGLKAGGPREFEIPVNNAVLHSVVSAASRDTGSVAFSVPPGSSADALSFVATRGALGIALSRVRDLISYPYGCAEQLAHSTYPNLVLLELSRRVPGLELRMSDLSRLVSRARENAAAGLQKLTSYQKADGGFSLWTSDPNTSPGITLMVHEVLSQASELGVDAANGLLSKSSQWLDQHTTDNTWTPWQLVRLAKYASGSELTSKIASFVVSTNKKTNPTLEELVYALAILQHHREMPWHRLFQELPDAPQIESSMERSLLALLGSRSLDQIGFEAHEFSGESLGFSPSRTVLLGDTLLVLRQMKAPPTAMIEKVERRLLDDLGEGRVWSPLDAALVIGALKTTILKELEEQEATTPNPVEVRDATGALIGMAKPIVAGYAATFDRVNLTGKDVKQISIQAPARDLTVVADLTISTPYSDVVEQAHGVSVTRTLLRVTPNGTEVLSPNSNLSVGDIVISKLEVSRPEGKGWWTNRSPSDWFVVKDGIPSIAEGIDDDRTILADANLIAHNSTWWSEVKETLRYPDRTERTMRLAQGGSMTSYSAWTVTYQGGAVVPPAHIVNMYLKGLEGTTPAGRVTSLKR